MKPPEASYLKVLTPYDPREGISLASRGQESWKIGDDHHGIGALSMASGVASEAASGLSAKLRWRCS